jgi:O-methyltransferase
MDEYFLDIWDLCKNNTAVNDLRAYNIYEEILNLKQNNILGDVAEVGVWRGGISKMMCILLKDRNIHLFDTFEGMPELHNDFDKNPNGEYLCGHFKDLDFELLLKDFQQYPNAIIHKGIFPSTAKNLENNIFSICHIDCDLYISCYESMKFFYPRLSSGGVIIVDDYDRPECPGAKIAINQFCRENNVYVDVAADFQAVVRKT